MVLKDVREKVEKTWTTTKKILAAMSVWGLIFSLVTISRLGAAFTYDDTLVHSAPAFEKAEGVGRQSRGAEFWKVVNNAYDLETPKFIPYAIAWALRGFGFRITIFAQRDATGGEALKKEWRHLSPRGFVFVPNAQELHLHLQDSRFVIFFGDGDRDILEARKAGIYAVRVRRGNKAVSHGDYTPGRFEEVVLPLSQF